MFDSVGIAWFFFAVGTYYQSYYVHDQRYDFFRSVTKVMTFDIYNEVIIIQYIVIFATFVHTKEKSTLEDQNPSSYWCVKIKLNGRPIGKHAFWNLDLCLRIITIHIRKTWLLKLTILYDNAKGKNYFVKTQVQIECYLKRVVPIMILIM